MTAKGKINASNVQTGDRIIVKTYESGKTRESDTKTGEGVHVARVVGKTFRAAQGPYERRGKYIIETTSGSFEAAPILTMWLAPEDNAGIKRARAEAELENAERDAAEKALERAEVYNAATGTQDASEGHAAITAGCGNQWHRTAPVRALVLCPDCPTPADPRQWATEGTEYPYRGGQTGGVIARPTSSRVLLAQMADRVLREEPLTFDLPNVLTLHSQAGKVTPISSEDNEQTGPAAMNTTTFFHQPTEVTQAQSVLAMDRPTYGSDVIRALENAWHFLMSVHPELPDVMVITGVGMEGFGGKWGHFRPTGWNGKAGDKRVKLGEIFLAGETLSKGGRKVMNTLTHEATHVLAHARGVQDTSRQHRYHNGTFRKLAEELGMQYTHGGPDKTIGFSAVTLTEVTVKAYEAIIEELDRAIQADVTLPGWLGGTGDQDGDDNGDQDGGENVHGKRQPKDPSAPKTGNRKCICNCDEPNIVYMSKKMIDKRVVECDDCDSLFREA